jgi:hypothetical protein
MSKFGGDEKVSQSDYDAEKEKEYQKEITGSTRWIKETTDTACERNYNSGISDNDEADDENEESSILER